MASHNGSLFGGGNIATGQRRTRLEVNLSEPQAQSESLAIRLELYTVISDGTFEAMAANYTPRIKDLEDEVEAFSNQFPISYADLLDKPVLLQGERGPASVQGL